MSAFALNSTIDSFATEQFLAQTDVRSRQQIAGEVSGVTTHWSL